MPRLTPTRRRGIEWLDEEDDPRIQRRSHRDIALANRLFGGVHAVRAELIPYLASLRGEVTLLDIGTGTGDIPEHLIRATARHGVSLRVIGLDGRAELVAATREWPVDPVCANALALPFATGSIDVVIASQVLHHFELADAARVLQEMHRVAKRRVIIADLRRSSVAAAALWLVSFPLGFHPVSRHDGVVSILRGFLRPELRSLVRDAVGIDPRVNHRFAYRITASWSPTG